MDGRPESAGPIERWDAIFLDSRGTAEMAHLFHIYVNSVSGRKLSMLGGIVTQPQHFVLQPLTRAATPDTLRIIRPSGASGPAGPDRRWLSRRGERLEPHPREGNRARPGRHQVRGEGEVRSGVLCEAGPWGSVELDWSTTFTVAALSLRGA